MITKEGSVMTRTAASFFLSQQGCYYLNRLIVGYTDARFSHPGDFALMFSLVAGITGTKLYWPKILIAAN
jgi:hypothetical protein